ncbi:MAG: flagellar protein FliT [Pseudomonadota bacterium]|nr:flagellar protein FliT [Pseudomonadota bacterium]
MTTTHLSPTQIIELYQGIARLMKDMVVAAQGHEWERLRELEGQCRPITHTLMAQEPGCELPDAQKRAKFLLLREILDDDAAIRAVTQSWMSELQALIGNTSTRRKLGLAYGSGLH